MIVQKISIFKSIIRGLLLIFTFGKYPKIRTIQEVYANMYDEPKFLSMTVDEIDREMIKRDLESTFSGLGHK